MNRHLPLLLLAGLAASFISAQPADLEPRAREIRELARRATDARLPNEERLRALDDSLDQRRALIHSLADDAPASLLLEHVEGLLSRFAWDGSDATAMFGVLVDSQRDAVEPIAREAFTLASRAVTRLDEEIARAADPNTQESLQRLRELAAPLVRARAAVILASVEFEPQTRNNLAVEAAAIASSVRAANDDLEARRRVILGQSSLVLARYDAALEDFNEALAKRSTLTTRMEAVLGRTLALLRTKGPADARAALRQAQASPPFIMDGQPMAIPVLLAADVEARIALTEANAAPQGPARNLAFSQAFAVYERLISRADLPLPDSHRRSLALSKINALAPDSVQECIALPPIVALARGVTLATTPGGFKDAVTLLESVVQPGSERLKAVGDLAPLALRTLADLRVSEAKAYEDDEMLIPAIRLYQRAGREYPHAEELALPSIISAVFYTSRWASARPDIPEPRDLLEESLRVGLESFPESRPSRSWREQLAEILLEKGQVDEALAQIDTAAKGAPLSVEGHVTLLRSLSAAMDRTEDPADRAVLANRILERAAAALKTADALPRESSDADRRAADTLRVLAHAASASARLAFNRTDEAVADAQRALAVAETLNTRDTFRAALVALVHAQAYAGDFDDALASAQRLARGAKEYAVDACGILIDLATAHAKQLDGALRPDDARALADSVIVPAARLALESVEPQDPSAADRWRAELGIALARAGQAAEAADVLKDLITRNGPDTRTLVWLGEASLALDNEEQAYDAFLQVVTALEQRQAPTEHYWHAWSRALQIFTRHNEDGSKTEQVRATITRLRINDPALGGEPYASRLIAIEQALNQR